MENIIDQFALSVKQEDSGQNLRKWALYILEKKIPVLDLIELLDHDRKTSMRFIWLIGDLCDLDPKTVTPAVASFYTHRNKVKFPNYDRSLAKMFSLCGIPRELEAEVIDLLFQWILDPSIIVSTKNYAVEALLNLSKIYPDLKNEIKIVLEDQLSKNSISFEKHAERILAKL